MINPLAYVAYNAAGSVEIRRRDVPGQAMLARGKGVISLTGALRREARLPTVLGQGVNR